MSNVNMIENSSLIEIYSTPNSNGTAQVYMDNQWHLVPARKGRDQKFFHEKGIIYRRDGQQIKLIVKMF